MPDENVPARPLRTVHVIAAESERRKRQGAERSISLRALASCVCRLVRRAAQPTVVKTNELVLPDMVKICWTLLSVIARYSGWPAFTTWLAPIHQLLVVP